MTIGAGWPSVAAALVGAIGLLFVPLVIRLLAALNGRFARWFLGPSRRHALDERVAVLETSRSRVVDAAEAERRRIERDLHDGAQQRLVALAMDLGMARERLATDPDKARQLLDEAHAEAKQALVELRNLARGIHPAVLTDRGLDAALSAVAARSPVPVDLRVERRPHRPGPNVEGIAYFVVSEAWPTWPSTPARPGPRCRSPAAATGSSSRSPTTAAAAPSPTSAPASPGCATGSPASTAGSTCRARSAGRPPSLVELPCGS